MDGSSLNCFAVKRVIMTSSSSKSPCFHVCTLEEFFERGYIVRRIAFGRGKKSWLLKKRGTAYVEECAEPDIVVSRAKFVIKFLTRNTKDEMPVINCEAFMVFCTLGRTESREFIEMSIRTEGELRNQITVSFLDHEYTIRFLI